MEFLSHVKHQTTGKFPTHPEMGITAHVWAICGIHGPLVWGQPPLFQPPCSRAPCVGHPVLGWRCWGLPCALLGVRLWFGVPLPWGLCAYPRALGFFIRDAQPDGRKRGRGLELVPTTAPQLPEGTTAPAASSFGGCWAACGRDGGLGEPIIGEGAGPLGCHLCWGRGGWTLLAQKEQAMHCWGRGGLLAAVLCSAPTRCAVGGGAGGQDGAPLVPGRLVQRLQHGACPSCCPFMWFPPPWCSCEQGGAAPAAAACTRR